MAEKILNTRIIVCNDTAVNWASSSKVLLKGEFGIEFKTEGTVGIKIGDGVNTFADLQYATLTPTEIQTKITEAINTVSTHTHSNKTILDTIEVALTNALKTNYDSAYAHSQEAHAPSTAQENIIEKIKVNGTEVASDSDKTVNITVQNITVDTSETETGYLKTYAIKNGSTVLAKINIPKDLFVKSGEIVNNPDASHIGTFIKLVLENQDEPLYIDVKDLVDVYTTEQNAVQVQLSISDTNEISATIVAGSVGTTEIKDKAVTKGKLADTVQSTLDKADSALQGVQLNGVDLTVSGNKVNITEISVDLLKNSTNSLILSGGNATV